MRMLTLLESDRARKSGTSHHLERETWSPTPVPREAKEKTLWAGSAKALGSENVDGGGSESVRSSGS
jgi:hypothetical protein